MGIIFQTKKKDNTSNGVGILMYLRQSLYIDSI